MMVWQVVVWFVWVDGAYTVFVQEFDPTEVAAEMKKVKACSLKIEI